MKGKENHGEDNVNSRNYTRFRTLNDLRGYLENPVRQEFAFMVYPVSGKPEAFSYNSQSQVVTNLEDGSLFDNMEDFLGYAFQCDREGYPNTEYVDVVSE